MAMLHSSQRKIVCHEKLTHSCANTDSIRNTKNETLCVLNEIANKPTHINTICIAENGNTNAIYVHCVYVCIFGDFHLNAFHSTAYCMQCVFVWV